MSDTGRSLREKMCFLTIQLYITVRKGKLVTLWTLSSSVMMQKTRNKERELDLLRQHGIIIRNSDEGVFGVQMDHCKDYLVERKH